MLEQRFVILEMYKEKTFTMQEVFQELAPYLSEEDAEFVSFQAQGLWQPDKGFLILPAEEFFTEEKKFDEKNPL